MPDGRGIIGAVDAIHRAAQIHGAGAERVAGAAGHETRQVGLALDHLGRRSPVRPFGLLGNVQKSLPLKAVAAHPDAVAQRAAAAAGPDRDGVRRSR